MRKFKTTGLFKHKESARNSAEWWRNKGYSARLRKVVSGWVVDIYRK